MRTKNLLVSLPLVISSIVTGACATNESEPGNEYLADAPPRDEIICRRERPVGSHVPVDVCYKRRDSEENQREALEALGPLRTMSGDLPPPPPPSTSN